MITNELKGVLGLCRRAGKMSLGHDASVEMIKAKKSYLAITCSDSSERLKKEIADECSFDNRNIKYIDADFDMKELALTIGSRAGVITINDRGFAEKLYNLMGGK